MPFPTSSTASELLLRAAEAAGWLGIYQTEMTRLYSTALVRGSAAALFKWDDRPPGYSRSHWRKIKKQRLASLPVTITITPVTH